MCKKRQNLTLLELVVTLGIVAVLASLLLDNIVNSKARECQERTEERGMAVRSCMVGTVAERSAGHFLADMGRWPKVHVPDDGDGDGGRRLAELYDPSIWYHGETASAHRHEETVPGRTIQRILLEPGVHSAFPAVGDEPALPFPDVSMTVGWNGPYLNISKPIGGRYFDGWGRGWSVITRYNLRSSNHIVEENRSGTHAIQIFSEQADFDGMRDSSTLCRIDGIASRGADGRTDQEESDMPYADAGQTFLFPHSMDNLSHCSSATMTVELRVRDSQADGVDGWKRLRSHRPWTQNTSYAIGDTVLYGTEGNERLYCCLAAHPGNAWDPAKWLEWSEAVPVAAYSIDVAVAPPGSILKHRGDCYCRVAGNSTTATNPEDDPDWVRLFSWDEIPEQISLVVFAPVMRVVDGRRVVSLGYYHFFRTASEANTLAVRPLYREGATAPIIDADSDELDVTADFSSSDYNGRYLSAEDSRSSGSGGMWNEFTVKRLVPGRRKIFCAFFNSKTGVYQDSDVVWADLKPGENHITLHLKRKR